MIKPILDIALMGAILPVLIAIGIKRFMAVFTGKRVVGLTMYLI